MRNKMGLEIMVIHTQATKKGFNQFVGLNSFDFVQPDAVSRKISLDTIVDFALAQGSQWILIPPHDISMVKHDERIKKQQLAAPHS